jgi:hypothetical protein
MHVTKELVCAAGHAQRRGTHMMWLQWRCPDADGIVDDSGNRNLPQLSERLYFGHFEATSVVS